MARYSHWFKTAYPHAIERQKYLQGLIENQPVSSASLRLAQILLKHSIARTVVTPNFDDFVSRALTTLGGKFRICDHPGTVERIDPEEKEIQIVHVHGTYWFYDLANLTPELEARARPSPSNSFTTVGLLDRIFSNRSPIIIGYSGWDGDVIMTALKRRLWGRLPYNMYFFCFRRSALDALPDWLKAHQDVFFVLPRESEPAKSIASPAKGESARPEPTSREANAELVLREKGEEPTLTAQQVFDELIRELQIGAPDLVADPLEFLAAQLETSMPQGNDPYSFASVVTRIRKAQECQSLREQHDSEIAIKFELLRDAVRRSAYSGAIQTASELTLSDLDEEQTSELATLVAFATQNLSNDPNTIISGAELAVSAVKKLRPEVRNSPPMVRSCGTALLAKAKALDELQRHEEEVEAYDELIRLAESTGSPEESSGAISSALLTKGITLDELGKHQEAVSTYDEVIAKYKDSPDPGVREGVAKALIFKADSLENLGKREDEIATYAELARRFNEATEPFIQELVGRALVNQGAALVQTGRLQEAAEAWEAAIARFGESDEPKLLHVLAYALQNKGYLLQKQGHSEDALKTWQAIVRRFGDSSDARLREDVALALARSAFLLDHLNRQDEASPIYENLVTNYWEHASNTTKDRVTAAMQKRKKSADTTPDSRV